MNLNYLNTEKKNEKFFEEYFETSLADLEYDDAIVKDNRAFCKYICPITIFLKPASYFSLLRVKSDHEKCIKCNKCTKNCPMNVDMLNDSRKRKNGTECILCFKCIKECPKKALKI